MVLLKIPTQFELAAHQRQPGLGQPRSVAQTKNRLDLRAQAELGETMVISSDETRATERLQSVLEP